MLDILGLELKFGLALETGMLEFPKIVGKREVEDDKSTGKWQENDVIDGTVIISLC